MNDLPVDELVQALNNLNVQDPQPNPDNQEDQHILEDEDVEFRELEDINMAFQPVYLKAIPTFDGEPSALADFVAACDLIINQFYDENDELSFLNKFLVTSIKGKLTGRAKIIASARDTTTWEDLREILRLNFADQRDENSLLRDLMLLRQEFNETPYQFCQRCQDLRSLLLSNLAVTENNENVKGTKTTMFDNMALKAFLTGLREPLGATIRSRNPESIEAALNQVIDEENIMYSRNRSQQLYVQRQGPSSRNRTFVQCSFCKKPGHHVAECRNKTQEFARTSLRQNSASFFNSNPIPRPILPFQRSQNQQRPIGNNFNNQNQQNGFGSNYRQNNLGNNFNRQNNIGNNFNAPNNFGNNFNRANNSGNNLNRQNNFGHNFNRQNTFGANSNGQHNFGNNFNRQNNFGNNSNQRNEQNGFSNQSSQQVNWVAEELFHLNSNEQVQNEA